MVRELARLVMLLCLLGAGAAEAAGLPQASAMEFQAGPGRTRVVIELDRPVSFRTFTIPRPLRLVLDLPEVEWRLRPGTRPRGLVSDERHGLLAPGQSRLVLDLAVPFRVARQQLLPPSAGKARYRIVVDLEATVPVEPALPVRPQPPPVVAQAPAPPVPAPAAPRRGPIPMPLARPVLPPVVVAALPPLPPPSPASVVTVAPGNEPAAGPAVETTELATLVVPPPPPVPSPALPVIVLDPGHGGIDPGTVGVGGVAEKDVVLPTAEAVREVLQTSGRYRVVLTREGDEFLALRERIARAREAEAAVFISLHADSLSLASQRGASVYTLSETASDEEAGRLASKENKADILADTDLSHHDAVVTSILIDLALRETSNRSIALAEAAAAELAQVTTMVHGQRRFAGFAVLKSPDIPSILLELGYLSNAEDARRLTQPENRLRLAAALLRALDRYFGHLPS